MSLAYGHPYMIDVRDCDARLPCAESPNDLYMYELIRLSVILGRVQKAIYRSVRATGGKRDSTIYSPSGLTFTTDEILQALLADLGSWNKNLPDDLQYHGADTPRNAGTSPHF